MQRKKETVVGLDVGTSKTCVLVAEADEKGEVMIIGVGDQPSRGLRKGEVIDIESAVNSIERAVDQAEQICNREIHSVFIGIGGNIQSFQSRAQIPIARPGSGVSAKDIDKAILAAQSVALHRDRELIHVIPQEFAVDGQRGIISPEGILGSMLEVQVHIVTAQLTSVQNLIKIVNEAGLEVEDYILRSLASSLAVLRSEEQKSGVVLIDIGGGTTNYLLFQGEILRHTNVLNVGGDHVTNDISIGLKLLQSQAEEVKRKHGCALVPDSGEDENISLPTVSGRAGTLISRRRLARIIETRMEEIFSLIKNDLLRSGYFQSLGSGVVLTGGGALLGEVVSLAEKVLDLPVRVGKPWGVTGLVEIMDSPAYAGPVGLVKYGFQHRDSRGGRRAPGSGAFARTLKGMQNWVKKYF